jgi:hypothetical protein
MEWINLAHGTGPVTGSCNHGNKIWDSINGVEILDQLSDYEFLKKYSPA